MPLSESYRRILHKMGYYDYQCGLIHHHLDEEGGWNTHLEKCRNFILRCVKLYKPEIVTVLGSGWLLDFPLREINELAGEINLVDIVHPPEVKKQVAEMKKVRLWEDDVTGGLIEKVWERSSGFTFLNKHISLEGLYMNEFNPSFDTGLVISLNVMTQLEALPLKLLKKRLKKGDEIFLSFRKSIQTNHISFLEKHNSVLITDLSEVVTEEGGKVYEIPSVLIDLPEGKINEEWTWNFDLRHSDYYTKKSVFRIAAISL